MGCVKLEKNLLVYKGCWKSKWKCQGMSGSVEDMFWDIGQCQKKFSRCWVEPRKLHGVLSSIKTTPMASQEKFGKCRENIMKMSGNSRKTMENVGQLPKNQQVVSGRHHVASKKCQNTIGWAKSEPKNSFWWKCEKKIPMLLGTLGGFRVCQLPILLGGNMFYQGLFQSHGFPHHGITSQMCSPWWIHPSNLEVILRRGGT